MLRLQFRFGTLAVLAVLFMANGVSGWNASAAAGTAVDRPGRGTEFTARVVAITDGDTIRVLRDDKEIRVRLNGIDCPEKAQPFGTRAKQFTADLAFGKLVTVQVRDTDRYGAYRGRHRAAGRPSSQSRTRPSQPGVVVPALCPA
jgi:endonuclease YncB( thermonuclease family)